ncbi:MAG: hypothetical protein WCK65_00240 [Rhodospirillaceae bacterium]
MLLVVPFAVSGCAGYAHQTAEMITAATAGSLDVALSSLESKNASSDKDILYYLDKGELLRMKGVYNESRDSWLSADAVVRQWEDDAKTDPSKFFGELGSILVNDTTRRYDGRDYEKVFLNVRLALDHIALGDLSAARTEITKMHEREATIAEFRSKELEAAVAKSAEKGIKATSFKELSGYPIETLDDPAVRALKNSYESAYGNFIAGFVYEALGEPSLAAPGYRKAAEMRPNIPVIDDSLKNLDKNVAGRANSNTVDTLFVVESGLAPGIESVTLPIILPIPTGHSFNVIATPLSWPVIRPDINAAVPSTMVVDDKTLPVAMLTDTNAMARRALSDEMPSIIARSAIRAISRGIAQAAIDTASARLSGNAALIGTLFGIVAKVATVATEVADERIWRTLPGYYSVARTSLAPGAHKIVIATATGPQVRTIAISGPYAIVAIRLLGNNLYTSLPPVIAPPIVAIVEPSETNIKPAANTNVKTKGKTPVKGHIPVKGKKAMPNRAGDA